MLSTTPVLYLDFDGVVHAYGEEAFDENFALLPNPRLFAWLPHLTTLLEPHPGVRIIVSSDWARLFVDDALVRLLGPLGPRFAGVVEIRGGRRRDDIENDAVRRGLTQWVALDDDVSIKRSGRRQLIWCDPARGLSDARVQKELSAVLQSFIGN